MPAIELCEIAAPDSTRTSVNSEVCDDIFKFMQSGLITGASLSRGYNYSGRILELDGRIKEPLAGNCNLVCQGS